MIRLPLRRQDFICLGGGDEAVWWGGVERGLEGLTKVFFFTTQATAQTSACLTRYSPCSGDDRPEDGEHLVSQPGEAVHQRRLEGLVQEGDRLWVEGHWRLHDRQS